MSMADHVILWRAGKIEQAGSPAELYARPASTFVARFIGTPAMNLVPLEAVQPGARAGRTLGIRPEHIRLVTNGSGVAAVVESAEYHGADTIVSARVGGAPLLERAPGEGAPAAGAPVRLEWSAAETHLFDAATGTRA